jgi:hypothetical protein
MEEIGFATCMACTKSFSTRRVLLLHLEWSGTCRAAYASAGPSFNEHTSGIRAHNRSSHYQGHQQSTTTEHHQVEDGEHDEDPMRAGDEDQQDEEGEDDLPSMLGNDSIGNRSSENGDENEGCQESFYESPPHTNEDYIEALLLSLCEKISAPQYAFDLILEWANYAAAMKYDFLSCNRTRRKRKTVVKLLCQRYQIARLPCNQPGIERHGSREESSFTE